MPYLFSSQPGKVGVVLCESVLPTFIELESFRDNVSFTAAVTGIAVDAGDGVQVTHSLREFVYFYSFGPRVKEIVIQGVAFAGACQGYQGSGLERSLAYFDQYRLSAAKRLLKISLGAYTALKGSLNKFTYQLTDASTGMGSFALALSCVPQVNYSLAQPIVPPAVPAALMAGAQ